MDDTLCSCGVLWWDSFGVGRSDVMRSIDDAIQKAFDEAAKLAAIDLQKEMDAHIINKMMQIIEDMIARLKEEGILVGENETLA